MPSGNPTTLARRELRSWISRRSTKGWPSPEAESAAHVLLAAVESCAGRQLPHPVALQMLWGDVVKLETALFEA